MAIGNKIKWSKLMHHHMISAGKIGDSWRARLSISLEKKHVEWKYNSLLHNDFRATVHSHRHT